MSIVEKVEKENNRYIKVFNILIPYFVEGDAEKKRVCVGPIKFSYYRDIDTEEIYLKILGKKFFLNRSRRLKHYKIRTELTDETCRQLLVKELSGKLGYKLNLENPQTFNEKINWLKLNNKDPRITICCDKYAVKKYATDLIGDKYIIPTLGVWNDPDEIEWNRLPEQFVIKVNWSSGFNIIVKNKKELDVKKAVSKLRYWMKESSNSYYDTFNWGYKHMKPVIYAEEYIEQFDGQVYDYKFYFSRGEFIYMFIATDRMGDNSLTYTFYDAEFKPLPFTYGNKPNMKPTPKMPNNLDKMLELAKILAVDFPFVRVDFYETGTNRIYLGEMTFYSGGGTLCFKPMEWDSKLGEKIKL